MSDRDTLLSYQIGVLQGERYDAPIRIIIRDTEREIQKFRESGFRWHARTLNHHLNKFKQKCKGISPDTPVSELYDNSRGDSPDTHRSEREGGDSY